VTEQRDLAGKVERLLEVGGSPAQVEDALKQLVSGYKDLAGSGEAKESLAFAAKILADKNSKLYKAAEKAGLLDSLKKDLLEGSLPYAGARALRDSEGDSKKAVQELRKLAGPLLKVPQGKELADTLSQIDKRMAEEENLRGKGDIKDATAGVKGLLHDLHGVKGSGGLKGLGLVFALDHALHAEGDARLASSLDVASLSSELGADVLGAIRAQLSTTRYASGAAAAGELLGRAAPILGAISGAVTLGGNVDKAINDPTAPNLANAAGDALAVQSGVMALIGAEPLALVMGVGGGALKLGAVGWTYAAESIAITSEQREFLRQTNPQKLAELEKREAEMARREAEMRRLK
jgi:hypothetical protein